MEEVRLNFVGGAGGAARPAGGSKAAFAMFQQKDVAAGGTGKASRYKTLKSNLGLPNSL